jgi:hypothetical protein
MPKTAKGNESPFVAPLQLSVKVDGVSSKDIYFAIYAFILALLYASVLSEEA